MLFLVVFFVLINFMVDTDFGWHVAMGEYMLRTGEVLRGDIFTWTMPGYVWGNSYVLYQLFIAKMLNVLGYTPLVFLFALVGAISFIMLAREVDFLKGLLTVLGAIISLANLAVRPHVFSFLFFCAMLVVLERKLYEKPYFSIISFVVFALWANLHRGFVFALLFYFAYIFLQFLVSKKVNKWAIVAFIAAIFGTLVTPFPVKIWSGGVADDFRTWENLLYIAEWFPTAFFFPINILFATSGAVLVYMFIFGKRSVDPVWFLLAALTFALAFILINLVSFWAAIFVFLVCRYFYIPQKYLQSVTRFEKYYLAFIVLLCTVGVASALFLDARRNWNLDSQLKAYKFPVGAVEYIKRNGLKGNLFNLYQWGGYIIWKGDGRQVFIDGRMAGWRRDGESILGEYIGISRGECDVLNKYDVGLVLVNREFNTECFVSFETVYEDAVGKVLLKT